MTECSFIKKKLPPHGKLDIEANGSGIVFQLTCWFCANNAFYEGLFTCALFCNLKHCSLDIIFYLCELNVSYVFA